MIKKILFFCQRTFQAITDGFKRLKSDYRDSNMTQMCLLFFQAVIPCFTNFNKLLQLEEPLVYTLN